MRFKWLLLLLLSFLWSCETEIFDFKTQNLSNAIVVFGEVTNVPGPYIFRLNYTSGYTAYDATQFYGQAVGNAKVVILQDGKDEVVLKETKAGVYQTPNGFVGKIGSTYQLKIKTADGLEIQSAPEKLIAPSTFSQMDYDFVPANKVENMRFDVHLKIKDVKNTEDFYVVKRQDYIQFLTTCPPPPPPPAPVPPCNCKCWQAPPNSQVSLVNDFLTDGQELTLDTKSVNYHDFTDWVIQFDLYHVPSNYYTYWKRLEEQRQIGGGLFDKIPAQVLGNLTCTSNADQQVLGYFVVAGRTKNRLKIDRFVGIPDTYYQQLVQYVEFNNVRYKDYTLWDCRNAAWVPYNLGFNIPD